MLGYFIKVKNCLPYSCYKTFYDIPLENYYKNGKKVLVLDLDNTLIPYDMAKADEKLKNRLNELKNMGYKIYICSNNKKERVAIFNSDFNFPSMYYACKPFSKCFRWVLKDTKLDKKDLLVIGDQLITDCLGSTRMGIDTIIVKPIKKKTEKWYTRLNRKNEKIVLKRMSKKYPSIYKELMENHED